MKTDNVYNLLLNAKKLKICIVKKINQFYVQMEIVSNNQTIVYHKILAMVKELSSKKQMEIRLISILDVLLINHLDVMTVHVEVDNKIVLFSLHAILKDLIDVYLEDVLKTQLYVQI